MILFAAPAWALEPPVLRVSAESEPQTLDWTQLKTATDRFLASFLMRGLLKYDASGKPVCDLCREFAASADGKTYRFELKPEVWSDGVALEARHFVDSYQRLKRERYPEIAGFRADGKERVEVTLVRPFTHLPHWLTTAAFFPVRKELVSADGARHAETAVLGPYLLAAWERGKRIVIEGNPQYKGERPVYRVDFVLGKHAELLARFKAGKLDIFAAPTGDDLLRLPGQKLQTNPYWATRYLVFNTRRVSGGARHAVLHGLERDTLPAFLHNGDRKATGLIPPGLPGYRELPLVTADLARARKERGAFGQLKILARDGDTDRRVVEWMTAQLGRVGVTVQPRFAPSGAYIEAFGRGEFDAALAVWGFETANPLEMLRTFATGAGPSGWTHVGYDALLGQGSVDPLLEIVESTEAVAIPLSYPTQPFLLGPRVRSFAITPFGDPDLVKIRLQGL